MAQYSEVGLLIFILSLGLIGVLAISFRIRHIRRIQRRKEEELKNLTVFNELTSPEPITFNVVTLGAKETGKTVFLATMFHHLNTELRPGGLWLSSEDDVDLTRIVSAVDEGNWPAGTVGARSFTLNLMKAGIDEPILRFDYYDYAGEIIDPGPDSVTHLLGLESTREQEPTKQLTKKIEAAHVLCGIIDGDQVAKCLNGEDKRQSYLNFTIRPMINRLRLGGAKGPVYFILTKWDMLDGHPHANEVAQFEIVAKELMSNRHIRNFVRQCDEAKRIVRLIPVSAIGPTFAKLDENGRTQADKKIGKLEKNPNGAREPVNIEIPLFAMLPDLFTQIEAELDQNYRNQIEDEGRLLARQRFTQAAADLATFLNTEPGLMLRTAFGLVLGANFVTERLADMFLDRISRVREAQYDPNDKRRVWRSMVEEFDKKVNALEDRFPASDLRTLL